MIVLMIHLTGMMGYTNEELVECQKLAHGAGVLFTRCQLFQLGFMVVVKSVAAILREFMK